MAPAYLDEEGDPWVLVSISSQMQDDVPLAQEALGALKGKRIRAVVTLGLDHDRSELDLEEDRQLALDFARALKDLEQ